MAVLKGSAHTPSTSAQYPQPAQPKPMDTATETALATMSLLATEENSIARFSKARCTTDRLFNTMESETPAAISLNSG